ncbi:hypothetical protein PENANT_c145G01263 [Penicillium antarcticum]|uniref:Uncharacterized protein n=1 Tax=Penicillium antarcticum TaxID=416450 RepID=A0A1V6PFN9_9EURO|nr:hypothetical protein PENANT_c145G01263 [Penicillium antarcticum]
MAASTLQTSNTLPRCFSAQMKTFRRLVETIAHFQSKFPASGDNPSMESFGTPLEDQQNTVSASAEFDFQERRDFTKQSIGESTPHSPQAVLLGDSRRSSNQAVVPQPIICQPIPIGPVYKPNRESLGTYLNPRTPPSTPQKSATLWSLIFCGSS